MKTANPRLIEADISADNAYAISQQGNPVAEATEWRARELKAIRLHNYTPCTDDQMEALLEQQSKYILGSGIDQYRNIPGDDPHLVSGLNILYQSLKASGLDPGDRTATTDQPISSVLILSTSDGMFVQHIINTLNPANIVVAINDWHDFVSSFVSCDWQAIFADYTRHPNKTIQIHRCKNSDDLLNAVFSIPILALDGTIVLNPAKTPGADKMEDFLKSLIDSDSITNCLPFLGFTIDEYNMMLNTTETLLRSPKTYRTPLVAVGGNYLVCGSGPSLDQSEEILRRLQNYCIVIAGGSNYSTLRSMGIRVDILALNERSPETYTDYKQVVDQFGPDSCKVIMSTTCPADLCSLFEEAAVYFRPSLTPLAIYSDNNTEVLQYEGPESVNTAAAIACALQADNVLFVGCDLGTTDKGIKRSKAACGSTPREFDITAKGNLNEKVYTSKSLRDVATVIGLMIRASAAHTSYFNLSDGILIQGAKPITQIEAESELFLQKLKNGVKNRQNFDNWWKNLPEFPKSRVVRMWKHRTPRHSIISSADALRNLFLNNTPWIPDGQKHVTSLMSLDCPARMQFARRMWRSTILRSLSAHTSFNHIVKKHGHQALDSYNENVYKRFASLVSMLEAEAMELCDKIDELLLKSASND